MTAPQVEIDRQVAQMHQLQPVVAQGCSFSFGNIGGKMIPVSIFGGGASRECAVYYENKLKLVVEVC